MIKALGEIRLKPRLEALGRALARGPMSPDAWTLAGLGAGVLAGVAIALRAYGPAAALFTASLLCDLADGLVARARGTGSPFGALLDVASDKYSEGAFFIGAAFVVPALGPLPGAASASLALLGCILVSLVSNVGIARTGRPAFKLADRVERGVIEVAALILAALYGDAALGLALVALAALSHLTVALLMADYLRMSRRG